MAIEKKMHEDRFGMEVQKERERVPKWNRDAYDDKADKVSRDRRGSLEPAFIGFNLRPELK